MNTVFKVFCRVFQTAFHLALPVLPYRTPEIYDTIAGIGPLLRERKVDAVLLITDSALRSAGLTVPLETLLREQNIRCAVYDKTCPNPTARNVEEARALYVDEKCQCLIAFGGGSSMDCAKAVGARVVYPNRSLDQLKGLLRVWRRLPLLIVIPTTAGTGSEVTVTAVITDSEKKHKYTMNNFTFIPPYAVLDPEVTFTLPPSVTATTGMDALTHAVEAYIGNSTSRETRALALETVKLVFENIEAAYQDGTNRPARANMLYAAHKAGIAFSKSYVGYVHAVAHSLGGKYNTPHGLANAVILPYVLERYGSCIHGKLFDLGLAAGVCRERDDVHQGAKAFLQAVWDLNRELGIPRKLPCIQKEDIPLLARHGEKEANPLYPVPRLMTQRELEEIYYDIADWSDGT